MDSKRSKKEELWPLEDEQLPVELQWENMEAGILQKMEELQSATASDNKKRRRRWWLFSFALLLGALIPTVLLINRLTVDENSQATTLAPRVASETFNVEEGNELCDEPQNHNEQLSLATVLDQQYHEFGRRTGTLESGIDNPLRLTSSTTPIEQPPVSDRNQYQEEKDIKQYNSLLVIEEPEESGDGDSGKGHKKEVGSISSSKSVSHFIVDPLPDNAIIGLVSSLSNEQLPELTTPALAVKKVEAIAPATRSISSRQIWLGGGVSWWNIGYGNTKPERAEFEQTILSYQGQFNFVQPLKRGLVLHLGLNYLQLNSRFNWSSEIEDYEVVLEDTIVQIQRNVFTGAQTAVRGSLSLMVLAERRVQHYNSMRLFQIPISIGKSWGNDRWQSSVLVGGIINIPLSITGRTLYQGEVVDYDDASMEIWSNKLGFGATLSGGLNYKLTDRFGVTTMLQFQQSITNWSAEQEVNIRPSVLNWSLGLSYTL